MTTNQILFGLGLVLVLAVSSQLLARTIRVPALVVLLPAGFLAGIATDDVHPDSLLGALYQPFVSIAVGVILFEAGLSFLGLGDPNQMSWGLMIGSSRQYVLSCWWAVAFPGAAIFITVLAVSLIGDGLNDALNPKLRER